MRSRAAGSGPCTPCGAAISACSTQEIGSGFRYVLRGSYGALFACQAAGMVGGTLLIGQTNPRRRRMVVMCVAFALNDLCMIAMALTPWFGAAVALIVLRGACIGFGMGVWSTAMMELVPESKLARVTSVDFFGSLGLVPVGYALTAVLAGFFAPSTILLAGFALASILWVAPLAWRPFRTAA